MMKKFQTIKKVPRNLCRIRQSSDQELQELLEETRNFLVMKKFQTIKKVPRIFVG